MKQIFVLCCLCGLVMSAAMAQAPGNGAPPNAAPPEAAQPGPEGEATEAAPPEQPPAEKKPERPRGDIITLKNGNVLDNVQVLNRTPREYEILVIEGVILSLNRRQVANIDYDEFEPSLVARTGAGSGPEKPFNVIMGNKLAPEFSEKMTGPIPDLPIKLENEDLVTILTDLGQRLDVNIVVDQSVKSLPPEERQWTLTIEGEATLMRLLQEDMLQAFPGLRLIFDYDKVVVSTKPPEEEPPAPEEPQQ